VNYKKKIFLFCFLRIIAVDKLYLFFLCGYNDTKMKVYLIVLLLIAPSLGRPGIPTPDAERDGNETPAEHAGQLKTPEATEASRPAEAVPPIKDDLRIHQEIAETILKSRNDSKNQGQNVVISATVSVNPQQNASSDNPPPKIISPVKNDDRSVEIVHHGVAVPLTMEEIEREMEMANKKQHDSSTSKEGISTWILVNGNGPTVQPELKSSQYRAEIDKKVDKIARIKEGQINKQTVDISNAINKRNEAKLKQRPKTTTTTTTILPDELLPVYDEEDYEDEDAADVLVEPVVTVKAPTKPTTKTTTKAPLNKKPQNNKQTPKPTTTTTTTEVAATDAPQKPETTTFLILEPKEAGFDMPQDRSPNGNAGKKKKRPQNADNKNNNADKKKKKKNENKKKPVVDSDIEVKNSTKAVNLKQPQKNIAKPISTQIYNYLAREVMPTVGVGLVGLVVAGGLASYLLGGPLGALRRSYDIQDRKDDLYHFNNEEYAGQADGQNEEDMFGKVIAGMPSSSLYRNNIRYQSSAYRPNQNQIYQQPAPQMHPAYSKYGPYNGRYRYNSGYRPGAPTAAGPPVAGPGYPSQYHQPAQPQQQSYPQPQYRYSAAASPAQQPSESIKTVYAQSQPSAASMGQLSPVYSPDRSDSSTIVEQIQSSGYSVGNSMDNQLQHRSQFVFGSAVPDAPAVTETSVHTEETEVDDSTAITVPEHGPRRKRSTIGDDRKISSKKINDNEIDNENDLDSNLYDSDDVKETETITDSITTPTTDSATSEVVTDTETVTTYPGQGTPFFDFFRRIIELKVRYGLSFLQNTTNAFQRYLSGVQERVNSSPIFNPQY
jgi:hypothetical protein